MKNLRLKWVFRLASDERKFRLFRVMWEAIDKLQPPNYPPRCQYSNKLSVSLQVKVEDCWVGVFWRKDGMDGFEAWVCILPCVPIRISLRRTWGGQFV